jgi:Domain of unknown function (DUF4326)
VSGGSVDQPTAVAFSGEIELSEAEVAAVRRRVGLASGASLYVSGAAFGVDLAALAALHGKTLGCWCAPRPCHGEVLQAAATWALAEQARRLSGRLGEMVAGA